MLIFARILSMIFTPFYLPLVCMGALFLFTYLNMLPWQYKLQMLLLTYFFTILIPTVLIRFYRVYHGRKLFHLSKREKRMVPYLISILSYLLYYEILRYFHVPHFMASIGIAALLIQIICAMINMKIKISTHMAAIGGVLGGVVAFSFIMGFNALGWISALIIIAGMVGTARMDLRIHSLSESVSGFLIGILTTFVTVIFL